MNNTTVGICVSPPSLVFYDDFLHNVGTLAVSLVSIILRLPVSIYILHLLVSRDLVAPEFFSLNKAICEILTCMYDILSILRCFYCDIYLDYMIRFFWGFVLVGSPWLLACMCVEGYVAIVQPVAFLRLKSLRYKLALCAIVWSGTLAFCLSSSLIGSQFDTVFIVHIIACCGVKLYCSITALLVLKKPVPGEATRQRQQKNNIKLRAFRTISIITISVILFYVPLICVISARLRFTTQQFRIILNSFYIDTALAAFFLSLVSLHKYGELPCIE